MEIGIWAIGLAIIFLCTIPFIGMAINRNKKKRIIIKELQNLAKSHNSDLGTFDLGIDFAIGLSTAKNYLYFYRGENNEITKDCIAINSIEHCRVNLTKQRLKSKKGFEEVLQKLELEFDFHTNELPSVRWSFYDSDKQYQPNGELDLIKKWEGNIKQALAFYNS
ncbi:MAG: hypothetical protein NXH90_13580 [Flavobacteriaceae bacterium]|nr:hypothetical protein [Flavobacteriaceae bacterium]